MEKPAAGATWILVFYNPPTSKPQKTRQRGSVAKGWDNPLFYEKFSREAAKKVWAFGCSISRHKV